MTDAINLSQPHLPHLITEHLLTGVPVSASAQGELYYAPFTRTLAQASVSEASLFTRYLSDSIVSILRNAATAAKPTSRQRMLLHPVVALGVRRCIDVLHDSSLFTVHSRIAMQAAILRILDINNPEWISADSRTEFLLAACSVRLAGSLAEWDAWSSSGDVATKISACECMLLLLHADAGRLASKYVGDADSINEWGHMFNVCIPALLAQHGPVSSRNYLSELSATVHPALHPLLHTACDMNGIRVPELLSEYMLKEIVEAAKKYIADTQWTSGTDWLDHTVGYLLASTKPADLFTACECLTYNSTHVLELHHQLVIIAVLLQSTSVADERYLHHVHAIHAMGHLLHLLNTDGHDAHQFRVPLTFLFEIFQTHIRLDIPSPALLTAFYTLYSVVNSLLTEPRHCFDGLADFRDFLAKASKHWPTSLSQPHYETYASSEYVPPIAMAGTGTVTPNARRTSTSSLMQRINKGRIVISKSRRDPVLHT